MKKKMKKNILELKFGFYHSYSKEFGLKIDAEHPDDYMNWYHVCLKEDCVEYSDRPDISLSSVHCEFHSKGGSNGEHWWIYPFSDAWDEAFERAGIECGYYSRKVALELLTKATRHWLDIKHNKGYYKDLKIIA